MAILDHTDGVEGICLKNDMSKLHFSCSMETKRDFLLIIQGEHFMVKLANKSFHKVHIIISKNVAASYWTMNIRLVCISFDKLLWRCCLVHVVPEGFFSRETEDN